MVKTKKFVKFEEKTKKKFKGQTCHRFHQRYTHAFFVRMLFWQLFSSYMHVEKAAETTFVLKKCAKNVGEIDTCCFFTITGCDSPGTGSSPDQQLISIQDSCSEFSKKLDRLKINI